MKKFSFTDAELRASAGRVSMALTASLPTPSECDHVFSEAFEEKMRLLIKKRTRRARRIAVLKRVAVFIIAALIGIGVWMTIDVEARARAADWIRHARDNIVVYSFSKKINESDVLPVYKLTWMPEGFELYERHESQIKRIRCHEVYYNAEGKMISFSYFFMHSGTNLTIMNTDEENEMISKKVRVKGMAGEFFYGTENDPGNILVLRDEKNNVMIVINSDIDKDSIMRMAKKIKVLK